MYRELHRRSPVWGVLDVDHEINFCLLRMYKAWKKTDKPPNRVKPIPMQVLKRLAFLAKHCTDKRVRAEAYMIIIAFFYLLQPGEYTDTNTESISFYL